MLKSISIKIDEELLTELTEISEKTERSKSFYIKEAIKNYMPQLRQLSSYKEELSEETLNSIREYETAEKNGTLETISEEQFWDQLGVE